jgi:hypothetical protein
MTRLERAIETLVNPKCTSSIDLQYVKFSIFERGVLGFEEQYVK